MEILFFGVIIGIGLAIVYALVLTVMAIAGIPLESEAGIEKRRVEAERLRQADIWEQARRNAEVAAAQRTFES